MRFLRFMVNGKEDIGVVTENGAGVQSVSGFLPTDGAKDMIAWIQYCAGYKDMELRKMLASAPVIPLDTVKICSPVKRPIHDILCVGVNYRNHLEETQENFDKSFQEPEKTVYFSKRAVEIIGPDEDIKARFDLDEQLDYEVELAVVIGKTGKDIPKEQAEDYIFGYSIFNDISSRALQKKHVQWYKGKSMDSYTAMGPWIVTKEEIPFPVELAVKSTVNGEVRQSSNTRMFLADIPSIISEFSQGITLEAGDIIATGTPGGVGIGFQPPRFMKHGDVVTCEIEGIGALTNRVKGEER